MFNDSKITDLINHFREAPSFTTGDVSSYFRSSDPDAKQSTINWVTHDLVKNGVFNRIGRGLFTVSDKSNFSYKLEENEKAVANKLHKQFPFLTVCVWNVSLLAEFFQHWPNINFTIVETDRDSIDSVFNYLKEANTNVYKEPDKDFIQEYIVELKNAIIVKPLISEAPVIKDKKHTLPQLEKIIVDIYTDKDIFYFTHGQELTNILENIISKYAINYDKLFRYAARRGKKEEISKLIKPIKDKE